MKFFGYIEIGMDFNYDGEIYHKFSEHEAYPVSFHGDHVYFSWNTEVRLGGCDED